MCVLLIGWKMRAAPVLVVAANRDEARRRPSRSPQIEQHGSRRILMPKDEQAGGTWLGVNDAGLAVAITNRIDGDYLAGRPSRGTLPLAALELNAPAAVRQMLETKLTAQRYNSFNLFCADSRDAWVASWDGELRFVDLVPGTYVLTNAHGLGELPVPEFDDLPWGQESWDLLRERLLQLLGDHQSRDENDYPIFKHGPNYGTVSSALFHPAAKGGWKMHFSSGNPCEAAFVQYYLEGDDSRRESSPPSEV